MVFFLNIFPFFSISFKKGNTPLLSVSQNEKANLDIVKILIDNKASINIKDKEEGNTPLHNAVQNENIDLISFLLSRGSDINLKNLEVTNFFFSIFT
jgi:ankyrin repeat protein